MLAIFFAATISINAQNRAYQATDSQVNYLLNRIVTRTATYKREINTNRLINSTDRNALLGYVEDFENATDALKQKFDARDSADADAEDVLNRAASINQFMQSNRLTTSAQTLWGYIRTDLNTLARYYSVDWNSTSPTTTNGTTSSNSTRVPDTTIQALIRRIATKTDVFKTFGNSRAQPKHAEQSRRPGQNFRLHHGF